MTASARLAGGALVLIVYAWALKPSPAAVSPAAADSDAGVEQVARAQQRRVRRGAVCRRARADVPAGGRAFRPSRSTPSGSRASYGKLNRAADEAAAWERFIDVSPTPVDACPAIGKAYARAGEPRKSLEAFERCVSFDPRNSEQLFFLGLAYEHAGRTADALDRYSKAAATRSVERRRPARSRLASPFARTRWPRRGGRPTRCSRAFRPTPTRCCWPDSRRSGRAGRRTHGSISSVRSRSAEDYVDVHIALGRVEAGAGRRAEARRHFERARRTGSVEARGARRVARARRRESLMRIVWSRAIAGVFWFATAAYCLLSAIPFASEQFLKPGLVPALVTFAATARVDLSRRARRLRGGACALAAVGPSRRARVHRRVGAGRRGAVLRAAAVAARAVDDRAGARAAVARAAGVDRPDGSAPGAHPSRTRTPPAPTRCPATSRPARSRRSP